MENIGQNMAFFLGGIIVGVAGLVTVGYVFHDEIEEMAEKQRAAAAAAGSQG